MKIYLIGTGGGSHGTMTCEAIEAVRSSSLLIGAKRLLEGLETPGNSDPMPQKKAEAIMPSDIVKAIKSAKAGQDASGDTDTAISVLFSGDTGFYSGASGLLKAIAGDHDFDDADIKVLPGLSSIQMLAAAIKVPYQDWKLVSAHGRDLEPVAEMMDGRPVFFLTGGDMKVRDLCRELSEAGLSDIKVHIGERLSYPDEKVTETTCGEAAEKDFDELSVALVDALPVYEYIGSGIPDDEFIRGDVPMTKRDVRSSVIGRLRLKKDSVAWDVGAGTGSVSVEMALTARNGSVYAVEMKPEAVELIKENREKFGAWNLRVISGKAPDALNDLPAPDSVFVGGSTGTLKEIVDTVLSKNPEATIVISAIALETLSKAIDVLKDAGLSVEIAQISSTYTRDVASLHMMMANNPIFLISGKRQKEGNA